MGSDKTSKGKRLCGTCGKPGCKKDTKLAAQTDQEGSRFELSPRSQLSCHFSQEAFPDLA